MPSIRKPTLESKEGDPRSERVGIVVQGTDLAQVEPGQDTVEHDQTTLESNGSGQPAHIGEHRGQHSSSTADAIVELGLEGVEGDGEIAHPGSQQSREPGFVEQATIAEQSDPVPETGKAFQHLGQVLSHQGLSPSDAEEAAPQVTQVFEKDEYPVETEFLPRCLLADRAHGAAQVAAMGEAIVRVDRTVLPQYLPQQGQQRSRHHVLLQIGGSG